MSAHIGKLPPEILMEIFEVLCALADHLTAMNDSEQWDGKSGILCLRPCRKLPIQPIASVCLRWKAITSRASFWTTCIGFVQGGTMISVVDLERVATHSFLDVSIIFRENEKHEQCKARFHTALAHLNGYEDRCESMSIYVTHGKLVRDLHSSFTALHFLTHLRIVSNFWNVTEDPDLSATAPKQGLDPITLPSLISLSLAGMSLRTIVMLLATIRCPSLLRCNIVTKKDYNLPQPQWARVDHLEMPMLEKFRLMTQSASSRQDCNLLSKMHLPALRTLQIEYHNIYFHGSTGMVLCRETFDLPSLRHFIFPSLADIVDARLITHWRNPKAKLIIKRDRTHAYSELYTMSVDFLPSFNTIFSQITMLSLDSPSHKCGGCDNEVANIFWSFSNLAELELSVHKDARGLKWLFETKRDARDRVMYPAPRLARLEITQDTCLINLCSEIAEYTKMLVETRLEGGVGLEHLTLRLWFWDSLSLEDQWWFVDNVHEFFGENLHARKSKPGS